jgi:ABC-type sugar transport system substrate-binding protein
VILSDRSITSENYISLVNADDWSVGRISAQWIAETLKGKGNNHDRRHRGRQPSRKPDQSGSRSF